MYRRVSRFVVAFLALLVAFMAGGSALRAQGAPLRGAVEGTVRDSASGDLRTGVGVSLDGTRLGALTDTLGHFLISNVPAGTYAIRARISSARGAARSILVQAGITTTIDLIISSSPVTLGAVRAQAQAPERDRFDLGPNVSSISMTKSAVSHVPSLGEPDVLRTVQLLPGVNARNDFSSGFNVRGGESDQNLILLDGYPIYNPFHLGGLFSTFLDETVGSIELLTGGFGADHGGRLSSVLDVVSADPNRTGMHGTTAVSLISSSVSIGSASADGRSGWMLAGRRTYADKLVAAISDKTFPYHFYDGQFHAVRALNGDNLKLSLTAYAGSDQLDADLTTFSDSANNGAGQGTFQFQWANQLAGISLSNLWRDHARLPLLGDADSVGFAQHVSFTRFGTGLDLAGGALTLANSVHELRVSGDMQWNRGGHERKLGYEVSGYAVHYDVQSVAEQTPLFTLEQHPTASAVYYQETWKPTKQLILQGGIRGEHLTGRHWSATSPRLSLKYFVNKDLAISAATGVYSQWTHSLNREDIPVRIFDFWVASDEYTPVSQARHFILGAERWLGPLRFVKVEGWLKKYNNLLEQNTADDPGVRGDEFLVSTGTSYGADLLLRQLDVGDFGGWVAYTYSVATRQRDTVSYWPGHDRRHNLNLVGTLKRGSHYTFSARLGLSTGTPYTDIVGQLVRRVYNPRTHTFESVTSGDRLPVGGDRNAQRYPFFQRLDLGLSRAGATRGVSVTPYLSIINAYNAKNVFIYDFNYRSNPPTREAASQFPFLPFVGLTVAF